MKRNGKIIIGVIIAAVVIGAGVFAVKANQNNNDKSAQQNQTAPTQRKIPVVVTEAKLMTFRNSITIQGSLEAKNTALVSPRIGGTIESIRVDEGDKVIADETLLFTVDSVKIEKAVQISKQDVAVAQCSLEERKANLEKVLADLAKTELDYKRFKELVEKEVISNNDFELQELRYKQAMTSKKHAETSVKLAEEQVQQAQAALAMAEKDLKDTKIVAPISGVINNRFAEPGEGGDVGKPILAISDVTTIEASAYLPSIYYKDVITGKTTIDLTANGITLNDQIITYKSPTINPKLQTFEIKTLIKNPPAGIVPGALANIEVLFATRESIGIPTVCVLPRTSGNIVFSAQDDKVKSIPVKTGWENNSWVEILDNTIQPGTAIVSMGQNQLNDDTLVSIQQGGQN